MTTKKKTPAKRKPQAERGITPKQEAFALAYLKLGNASQAYRVAYDASGMTSKTITEAASRLLKNSNVAAMVAQVAEKTAEKAGITVERTLAELAKIAYHDPRTILKADGTVLPINEWPDGAAGALSSLEVDEIQVGQVKVGEARKVKFWDKNAALEKAMKHLGLFEKDNKQGQPTIIMATPLDQEL